MGRSPKEESTIETPTTVKHKVVCMSDYYQKVQKAEISGNIRDISLAMLFDEWDGKIVAQVHDIKSGDIKFVVKI